MNANLPVDPEILSEDMETPVSPPPAVVLPWHKRLTKYLKQLALTEVGLCVFAALTFIFTGNLSLINYSERLFYVGLFITLIGGFVAVAVMVTGTSVRITKPEQARHVWDTVLERRQLAEKRYDASVQVWFVGAICIAISAVLQIISARYGL